MNARTGERGQVLPLVAICLAVMIGFGGLAVDVGYLEYQQRQQQNAADGAAIGGAQQLVYSGCPNPSAASTAAKNDAASNGFADGGNGGAITVFPNNPPASGPYASNNCAVQVSITNSHAQTWFSQIFGFNGMPETTTAVAALKGSPGCYYALGPGQNTNFNGATVDAPNCTYLMNGSANTNGASIDVAGFGEVNYSGSNNSGTFTEASPTQILPVADPCPEIAGCAYLTANPPSTASCNATYTGGSQLQAGCYSNLNVHGVTLTLVPSATSDIFIFAGSSNFNGATITGTGVTIYIPAGATPPNFNKANNLTLSPPTTGPNAGVTYYQVPSNSNDVNLNATQGTKLQGLIYAPSSPVNYNGTGGEYVVLVTAYTNFNGSTHYDFGTPGSGLQFLIQQPYLAQ